MKILVFGKGFLGNRIVSAWPDAVLSDARIEDREAVLKAFEEHKPDAVINCAGKTGRPNVDWCEAHQAETATSNILGPIMLAEACSERSIYLIHLASGCVFYGPSPEPAGWNEEDFANPESFYSRSKYASDLVLSRMPNVAIARIRMPIDNAPSPRNLIDKLISYKQVIDVENSITIIEDLLTALRALIEKRPEGIFHVVNPGTMRHRDLIDLYREYVDPNHQVEWINDDELLGRGLAIAKRSNCILQSKRLEELGIHLPHVSVSLREAMIKYAAAKRREQNMASLIPGAAARIFGNAIAASVPGPVVPMRPRAMKGVILAGGTGSRLAPLTNITNKHLLPIFNKPMVLYPLQTFLDAGIKKVMIVTGPDHAHQFIKLLGSGSQYGCEITYRIQDKAGGISHALSYAEEFVGSDNCAVILGDNIFDENFADRIASFKEGGTVFYKPVANAREYGVIEMDGNGVVRSIEEKPMHPKSNLAQVGLYVFESSVFEVIKTLKPSDRGELEVTDLTGHYMRAGKLLAKPVVGRWWDAGTFAGMADAGGYFAGKQAGSEASKVYPPYAAPGQGA